MAFMKMLWQTKLYDFNVFVKTSIRNSWSGGNALNVNIKISIRNY